MTTNYKPEQIQTCLPSRRLVFVGDSITRQLFYSMAKLADPQAPDGPPSDGGKHADAHWKAAKGPSTLLFHARQASSLVFAPERASDSNGEVCSD